jgi:hypothetical protein
VISAAPHLVRLENLGPHAFAGWKRTTLDRLPRFLAGRSGSTRYVVGRRVGLETHVIDVHCTLPAGGKLTLDLDAAEIDSVFPAALPDAGSFFGGLPTIAGAPMLLRALRPDGAGWSAHFAARTGPMLHTDLWLTWYPGQPWCSGEVLVTASNPSVPDLFAEVPTGFDLRFGSAIVAVPGGTGPLIAAGTKFADGQARALPVTFLWYHQVKTAAELRSFLVAKDLGLCAVGVEKLLADGNPSYPVSFNPRAWAAPKLTPGFEALHSWAPLTIGPAPNSTVTGAQEEQVFTRGEALLPNGVGCELVTYLAALRMAARPCQHLEADGSPLDPAKHTNPRLLMWDMRAHWHAGVSPDRLGKPRNLSPEEIPGGFYGADVQHWLIATLTAGARYTGSPVLQRLLANQANAYLLQRTSEPSWSTSGNESAREVGYEGIGVVHLWRDLEDRQLAQRVVDRWRERVLRIILPTWGAKEWWDVRTDVSASVPFPPGPIPWQAALGTYGLDYACAIVGPAEGRALALRGAKRVLADCWSWDGTRWAEWDSFTLGTDGTVTNKSTSGFFRTAWLPCAVATVLRHEPQNEKARAVWAQLLADTANGSRSWLPPGVNQ